MPWSFSTIVCIPLCGGKDLEFVNMVSIWFECLLFDCLTDWIVYSIWSRFLGVLKSQCPLKFILFCFSGPIEVLVLAGDDAIARWRTVMGPTKVYKTIFSHPDSIRGQFGISDTRNACHGSDSMESVIRETGIFFPDFQVYDWLRQNSKW